MSRLFDITNELDKILDADGVFINTESGEVLSAEALESLNGELNDKLDSIGAYVKALQVSAKAHKEQAKWQMDAAKADEKKAASLIEYVRQHTEEGKRYKLLRCDWRWRKSDAVEITDEKVVPDEFKKITVAVDKAAVKKALKEGKEIAGVRLDERIGLSVR